MFKAWAQKRRQFIIALISFLGLGALARRYNQNPTGVEPTRSDLDMSIIKKFPLDFQWQTQEPFLFCVHHYDHYPQGNEQYGPPKEQLVGRNLGQDFSPKDGYRMYHGEVVPGFPVHPHRGFETITIVRKGYVDHADSMGAAGRYGQGDVQWMTAGSGVQHSEMFPLLRSDAENTLELFQIWLNLPRKSKMVEPHFKMFWSEKIPKVLSDDKKTEVTLIAGSLNGKSSLAPPPDSWASHEESDTQVWLIKIQAGGEFNLPATTSGAMRTLYFFNGPSLSVDGQQLSAHSGLVLNSEQVTLLVSSTSEVELLLLQSKPIGEPVVQYGPFVMNSEGEIRQTIKDYQQSQFGGWPWPTPDTVHGGEIRRFARFPDGSLEEPKV
jgi:quercetin 2,3-dioxygenase